MSVIEASSGTYRSRVDGTIVLSVEIEPRYRADALALFGMPGTPMALAALKTGARLEVPKTRIGQYCMQAVELCRDTRFWDWVAFATLRAELISSETAAVDYVKRVCGLESRKDLDTDDEARQRFDVRLFRPFNSWLAHKRAA